jgi:uncharacterized protein (DUF362 family)
MKEELTRRELLRLTAAGAAAWGLSRIGLDLIQPALAAAGPVVVIAKDYSPAGLVQRAMNGLGGMKRFVHPGSTVLVKPNAAWAQPPQRAATTNPEVLVEIIRLCKEAGARVVKVMDNPCDQPDEQTFAINGLRKAAEQAGAVMISGRSASRYGNIHIPRGKVLKNSQVLKEVLQADVFINVPIAKVHGSVPLTLGLKNLMGVTLDRGAWHNSPDLNQAIADYSTAVRPHLIIMDAVRVLLTNGPRGPGKVKDMNMVIAGTDPVAVDAFTTSAVFNMKPAQIRYLVLANAAKVGEMDLNKIVVKKA